MKRINQLSNYPLLFISLFTLTLLTLIAPTPATPTAEAGRTNLVLAFYYAWFDPSSFDAGKTPYQNPSPYYSTDAGTIQRHVNEARGAGIDGFVQSWYGPGNQTETNFQTLLNIASGSGFKAAVDFEAASPFFASHEDRISAMQTLINTHAQHPAYLRVDGRPVIFFWANWLFSVDDWAYIRNQTDPNHNTIWIAEGGHSQYLSVFDGLHLYNVAWSQNPAGTAQRWAAETRNYGADKYWVGTAMPGYNDSLLGRGNNTIVRSRNDGAFFRSSFSGAASSSPDMLIINSFNEWPEGSHIEASVEFGNTYLNLAAELANAYKSGSLAYTPPPANDPAANDTASNQPAGTPLPTWTPGPTATPVALPTPSADGRIIYRVQSGDTLLVIANRFDISVDVIYAYNQNITNNTILSIGQEINLGITEDFVGITGLPGFPNATVYEDGTITHVVQPGDTFLSLAIAYQSDVDSIYAWNNLTPGAFLQINQELIVSKPLIPAEVGGSTDQPPTETPAPTNTPLPTPSPTPLPTAYPQQPQSLTNGSFAVPILPTATNPAPPPSPTPPATSVAVANTNATTDESVAISTNNDTTADITATTTTTNEGIPFASALTFFIGIALFLAGVGIFFVYLGERRQQ
ncbi:MAG TPA: endo-1,3-alpha-glucanase family glycosylhydrolase [Anaerolineae bacterium]|nr:endo-1,3-alpha-glucanase family glycosylhydrolase [Anaerolineae bacterium]